ncbi:LysR family transcriptional regulator [Methylobacterium sp. NPDC080182]|uniref:LysR family transcriptional regulator n=1 Tax=Methylobacterium sp. NPDC080182 TaxID=3390590 RepID=UPI003CFED289
MEVRHLRYFLTTAETGSYKLSAERLNLGQASLERAMRALEVDLKTRLFVRRHHTLELTRAGHVLKQAAAKMVGEAEALPDRVNRGTRGEIGTLQIGLTGSASFNPLIPTVIQAYRQIKPGIDLVLSEGNSQDLCDSLFHGRLDVAFVRPMQVPGTELDCYVLIEEEMALIFPPAHPLAERSAISAADLKDEPFVMFRRDLSPTLYDTVISAFVRAGITMRIVQEVPQLTSLLSFAAAGVGLTVLPVSLSRLSLGCTVRRKIDGLSLKIPLSLASRSNDSRVIVSEFVSYLRRTSACLASSDAALLPSTCERDATLIYARGDRASSSVACID